MAGKKGMRVDRRCLGHLRIRYNTERAAAYLEALRTRKIMRFTDDLDGAPLGCSEPAVEWALVECGAMKCGGKSLQNWTWTWPPSKVTFDQALAFQRTLARISFSMVKGKWTAYVDGKAQANFRTPYQIEMDRRAAEKSDRRQKQLALLKEHNAGVTRAVARARAELPPEPAAEPVPGTAGHRLRTLESLVAALDGRMADILAGLRELRPAEQLEALVLQTNRMMTKHDDRSEKRMAAIEKYLEEILDRMTAPAEKTEAA